MSIDSLLGAPGQPVMCKVFTDDISMHWFESDAKKGAKCLCGKTVKK